MSTVDDNVLDDGNDDGQESKGMKQLRAAHDKLVKQLAERDAELTTFRANARKNDMAGFLEEHGAPKRLARYASTDIEGEVDSAKVLAWLKENGQDFGWAPKEELTPEQQAQQGQASRIGQALNEAPDPRSNPQGVDWMKSASIDDLINAGVFPKRS